MSRIKVNQFLNVLLFFCLCIISTKEQNLGNRLFRNEQICHMSLFEGCFENVNKLGEENTPTALLSSENGFEKLCRFVFN